MVHGLDFTGLPSSAFCRFTFIYQFPFILAQWLVIWRKIKRE